GPASPPPAGRARGAGPAARPNPAPRRPPPPPPISAIALAQSRSGCSTRPTAPIMPIAGSSALAHPTHQPAVPPHHAQEPPARDPGATRSGGTDQKRTLRPEKTLRRTDRNAP